jgi:hypothetical protein
MVDKKVESYKGCGGLDEIPFGSMRWYKEGKVVSQELYEGRKRCGAYSYERYATKLCEACAVKMGLMW